VNPADKPPNYDPDKDNDNFTKDAPGNTMKKGDFKHQLNEAAVGGSNEKGNEQTMFEKGMANTQPRAFPENRSIHGRDSGGDMVFLFWVNADIQSLLLHPRHE
jgi:hypothetical protein